MMSVLNHLRTLRLSAKVALLGAGGVLMTAVAMMGLAVWQSGRYNALAQIEVDELINADLDHITQGIYNLVQTENEAAQHQVNYDLNVARHVLTNAGDVSLSKETATWTAYNQFTAEPAKFRLPRLLIGGNRLVQNADPAVRTAVVDEVTKLVDETATIFQRANENGDMLRVATTVLNAEGKRAIGTYIPTVDPDGTLNPVIASILKGNSYRGRAFVVDTWYLTAYEPIKDSTGGVLGMLYVGIKQKKVESRVRQAILQTKVGKTGYVYVLGGKGENRGHYIVSRNGERDGEDIWDNKDSDGRYVIRAIASKALTLRPGELATERYRWQNPGESTPRWKVARLAYFEPWDWVIGTSVYEDELQAYQAVLSGGRSHMTSILGLAGLVITLCIGLVGILVAWTIARPVRQMTRAVETIIHGNLEQVIGIHSRDEIGQLAHAFNRMTLQLRETLEALRRSEQKLKAVVNGSPIPQFVIGPDHRVIYWNKAMEEISGVKAQEMIGTQEHWRPFYEEARPCIADLLVDGAIEAIPEWYRDKYSKSTLVADAYEATDYFPTLGKEGKWLYFTAAAIRDSSNNVIGVVETLEDVTERKRAVDEIRKLNTELEQRVERRTRELANSLALIRATLESTVEGILAVDNLGRVTYTNDRFLKMWGIRGDQVISELTRLHEEVFLPQLNDPEKYLAKEVELQSNPELDSLHVLKLKDGRCFEQCSHPQRTDDRTIGRVWSYRDITERRALESQLRQLHKLEAVGQLAAGVAHEINTPTQYVGDNTRFVQESFDAILRICAEYAELLAATKSNSVTPELIQHIEELTKAESLDFLFTEIPLAIAQSLEGLERIRKIVAAMKEFSHPGGKEKSSADLNRAIESTATVSRNEWKYVADLKLDLDPTLPPVFCYLSEFNQAILNLIVNASYAIGDVERQNPGTRGTITVSTRQLGDQVEVRVSDTGTGIPAEIRPRIFEPFFTTKDVGKGTGQGLSVVHGSIVKRHGGSVTFESEVGKGTTFIILLPIGNQEGIPQNSSQKQLEY
jgi:PAS domain S-box-containing protein